MSRRRHAGDYPGLGARDGSAKGAGNVEGRLRRMNDLRPLEGEALLDIGCANGAYTMRMASGFGRTLALDIEPDRLEDFRRLCDDPSIEIVQRSATETEAPDASFDAVTAIETVEHLGSLLGPVVAEVHRVLRPGGTFYLTTPNRWWPLEQHGWVSGGRRHPGWTFPFLTWVPSVHRRFSDAEAFRPAQLRALIVPYGFEATGLTYMMPPLDRRPGLGRVARPVLRAAEATPARTVSQTLVMTFAKAA